MRLREATESPTFVQFSKVPSVYRSSGQGTIARRPLDQGAFAPAVDHVDFNVIPSDIKIGRHEHVGTEEIYRVCFVPRRPRSTATRRLERGGIALRRAGEWHALVNDGDEPAEIFVFRFHV